MKCTTVEIEERCSVNNKDDNNEIVRFNDSQIGNKQKRYTNRGSIVQYFHFCFNEFASFSAFWCFDGGFTYEGEGKLPLMYNPRCVYQFCSLMGCLIVHSSKVFGKLLSTAEGRFNINKPSNTEINHHPNESILQFNFRSFDSKINENGLNEVWNFIN